ncbi:ferrous iron transporter B, partial [Candidatus Geothermarchaeota archaeon]
VSTLAVLYGGEAVFKANLLNAFSPVSAFAYIIFVLLYVPCIATMAVLRSEFGNKTMIFTIIYMMLTAYIASYIVVVLATLLGV